MEDADDIMRLYAALLALETAEGELDAMGGEMRGVATELVAATAAVAAMRVRLRRLRSPYFKQRMERFHARHDDPDGRCSRD